MYRTLRALLPLFIFLWGSRVGAQTLGLQPPMQIETPLYAQQQSQPSGPAVSLTGMPTEVPHLSGCSPYEDNNGPLLKGDPLLDGKLFGENVFGPGPLSGGWFATLEANAVVAHFRNEMYGFVGPYQGVVAPLNGFHLNGADLDWTASPLLRAGYRMGQGAGELMMSYQYVSSEGSQLGTDASGNAANISSHLAVHVLDMQYACNEFSLGPWCEMKWLMGVRVANAFWDTQSSSILGQQALSNNFVGAGPVLGLNLSKNFRGTGLDMFCHLECAMLFGPATQDFTAGGAMVSQTHSNVVFVPKVEAGVGWRPIGYERVHFAAGYTFQYWSNLAEDSPGGIGVNPNTRGDLTIQGGFLRAEWNY